MTEQQQKTTHYVAHIKVERVDRISTAAGTGYQKVTVPEEKRYVTELASVTVKNDELETVIDKVSQHLALIDDIDAVDPRSQGGTR